MLERTVSRWTTTGDAVDEESQGYALTENPAIPLRSVTTHIELAPLQTTFDPWASTAKSPNTLKSDARWLDLTVASAALVFFAPLMGLIALTIFMTSPGPILYRQSRLGFGGRAFGCLKFRTMRHDSARVLADLLMSDPLARAEWEASHKLRRDPRVSLFGTFLRKTSLDELPQLFNVLAGDMSVVGPRPIVPEEAYRYRRYIRSYYSVKPGITGLWQISGRNHTTYRRRVACDVKYSRNRNAYRDVAIIALTIPTVLTGRGAY